MYPMDTKKYPVGYFLYFSKYPGYKKVSIGYFSKYPGYSKKYPLDTKKYPLDTKKYDIEYAWILKKSIKKSIRLFYRCG
jgi:hypothetical protein